MVFARAHSRVTNLTYTISDTTEKYLVHFTAPPSPGGPPSPPDLGLCTVPPPGPPCNPPLNVRPVPPMGGGLHHTMVALKLQQFQYNLFFGAFWRLVFPMLFVKVIPPIGGGGDDKGVRGNTELQNQWTPPPAKGEEGIARGGGRFRGRGWGLGIPLLPQPNANGPQ